MNAEAMIVRTQMGQAAKGRYTEGYEHPEADALLRPDIGTRAVPQEEETRRLPLRFFVLAIARPVWAELAREQAEERIVATQVQASMGLAMGDLLRNLRSGRIFSICGLPDARVERVGEGDYRVELLGLHMYDPVGTDSDHREGAGGPAWFPYIDYNGLRSHLRQAFFPKTSAWEGLRRSPRGAFDKSVWPHPSGPVSAPFGVDVHGRTAMKAVDDRGNELMVVKPPSEAETGP